MKKPFAALLVWIAMLAACIAFTAGLHINTEMAAFLPRTASPAQRILIDQFRNGLASHLVLVAIEGGPPDQLAAISSKLAERLRTDQDFVVVENGAESGFARDGAFLWSHRYLLSDQVVASRFTRAGLRAALEHDLADLASATGFVVKRMLPEDPTEEMLHLIEQQQGGGGPDRYQGVWFSADHSRALMLVRLRAAGSDIDGEQQALKAIQSTFHDAIAGQDTAIRLLMSGPPVFAVEARDRIRSDAERLSVLASLIVATTLLLVYRSPRVLLLAFVPVVSGALAGIAAVGLAFRTIHGITLGFGATLIGEAVDYAVYLFTQTSPDSPVEWTIRRIWPTLRLGVLTSVCGFAAMLLSSFEGFEQLGLFTMTGLAVAACVTRWVLPTLLPQRFAGVRQSPIMLRIAQTAISAGRFRNGLAVLVAAAAVSLVVDPGPFWAAGLNSLSPVSPAEQRLDRLLRQDMREPDSPRLLVIHRPAQETALQAAEKLSSILTLLIHQGALAGFDTPSSYLPSLATQQARRDALPDPAVLQDNLDAALDGLPFQPGLFAPFVTDVSQARSAGPINRAELEGTSLSLRLDSLLVQQSGDWLAVLPLRGITDPAVVARAVANEPDVMFVDLKAESDRLLGVFLREGISLACLGAVAICVLLLATLRSWRRVIIVLAPLAASVVVTLAILRLGGRSLSIFNLFGLLLVVAIGSNYSLFFDRQRHDPAGMPRVLTSLLLANGCTVAGFGVLALSQTPVLHGLGIPVAIGTFLSLLFTTIIMSPLQTVDYAEPH